MNFKVVSLTIFLALAISYSVGASAQTPTPPPQIAAPSPPTPELAIEQIKKCVVFIQAQYVRMIQIQSNTGIPQQVPEMGQIAGTGFLIFVTDPRFGSDRGFTFLVTNKHLIRQPGPDGVLGEGPYLGNIIARINTKKPNPDGTEYGILPINVIDGTGSLDWFIDPTDDNLDLVMTPISLDFNIADSKTLPIGMFATKEFLAKEHISEIDEVLFTGLFASSPGVKRNYPIVRHGKLARLATEPIPLDVRHAEKTVDVHLADVMSFGGNSGSPVFLRVGGIRESSAPTFGYSYYLLGVMKGYFNEGMEVAIDVATKKGVAIQNSGIAAVIPADKILQILETPRARAYHDRALAHKYEDEGNLDLASKTMSNAVDTLEKAAPQHSQFAVTLDDYARLLRKIKHDPEALKAEAKAKAIRSNLQIDLMHPKM